MIPTLGKDLVSLSRTLLSVRSTGLKCVIVLVCPKEDSDIQEVSLQFDAILLKEEDIGLYAALNQGIRSLPSDCEFYSILGDDDTLDPIGFKRLVDEVMQNRYDIYYGGIRYVDNRGDLLFTNYGLPGLQAFILWTPNLIPHPGSVIRKSIWEEVGGYSNQYKLASDLDFWFKARKLARFRFRRAIVANFRFSSETLTGGSRLISLSESKSIRINHAKWFQRPVLRFWDPFQTRVSELILRRNLSKHNTP